MALTFSDTQIKDLTKEQLDLPGQITRFQGQKSDLETEKQNFLDEDNENKVFTDNILNILEQYFLEKTEINGVNHARYSETFIQDAPAKDNDHFQTSPPWKNFQPKVLPENNGNPTTTEANFEIDQIPLVESEIDTLINGFTDGAIDDTTATAPSAGEVEVDSGGFSIGDRIVINNTSGDDLFGEVTDNTATPASGAQKLAYTITAGSETGLGIGDQIRNFHPGFTDDERENVVTPDAPDTMQYFKDQIDPEVQTWEDFLTAQLSALNANDAPGDEATEINTAISNVTDAISDIDNWQAAPNSGDGVGRYGDTALSPLQSRLTTRSTQAPARITEIDNRLGSVAQDPNDGTFSGSGNFKRLFDFVNLRINLASGSLQKFFRADQGIEFFDQQIQTSQDKLDELNNTFLVKLFAVDGDGTEFIELNNVTGLSVSDETKIMDNNSSVFTRNIVNIVTTTIEVDSAIGVNLLVNDQARVVKQIA